MAYADEKEPVEQERLKTQARKKKKKPQARKEINKGVSFWENKKDNNWNI